MSIRSDISVNCHYLDGHSAARNQNWLSRQTSKLGGSHLQLAPPEVKIEVLGLEEKRVWE